VRAGGKLQRASLRRCWLVQALPGYGKKTVGAEVGIARDFVEWPPAASAMTSVRLAMNRA